MASEQARGLASLVGPASDGCLLEAMPYERLTGPASLHEQANRSKRDVEMAYEDLQQEQRRTTVLMRDVNNLEARRKELDASLENRQRKPYEMLMRFARAVGQGRGRVQVERLLDGCPEHLRDGEWRDLKLWYDPRIVAHAEAAFEGAIACEERFHRSISISTIKDNILDDADFSGNFHGLDAKSGKVHWTYDMLAACWGSALVVDGKVYIADEDGDAAVFRQRR